MTKSGLKRQIGTATYNKLLTIRNARMMKKLKEKALLLKKRVDKRKVKFTMGISLCTLTQESQMKKENLVRKTKKLLFLCV